MQTNNILTQSTPASQPVPTPQEEIEFLRKKVIPFLEQELKKYQQKLKVLLGET